MNQHFGRALVIDDDALFRELCAETLRRAGFAVEALESSMMALETIKAHHFDIVILDLYLPDLDGLRLLEQLRERRISVPILLISGGATVEQAAHAMRLGARGLLLKPFKAEELRQMALEIAGERRAARSRDRISALRPAVRVGERLLAELDLPRLQNQIIDTVRAELDADRASLMLIEEGGAQLHIAACSGLPPHVQVGHKVPMASSLAGAVAARRQPVRIDAEGEVTPPAANLRGELFEDQIVSALCVPVMARDRVLGVLNAAKVRTGQPFSEADQELLVLLAAQAAIAIENARLYTNVAQSEARYRALLQHATDSVLLLDAAGAQILDANLALENLSGYSRAELLAMAPTQLIPEVGALVGATARNGRGNGGVPEAHEIEAELRTRAEISVQVAASVSKVPYEGQQLLLVIARDISERQRLAKQLVQAEKLAALGRLSASLAHEINNPLQAIHNSVHLMLSRPLSDEKRHTYLTMTQDEIERLISIVQRTLDFYRPNREGMRPVDVNEILDTVLTLTESQLHERRVQVVREGEGPPRLPWVFAISGHLKQVCFNLIFNAVEAMPDGGELRVRTYLEQIDQEDEPGFVRVGTHSNRGDGPWVVIEIGDTGAGIAAQDLPKIFEPFYTTRFKGTGLGLAVSYSIVEQHHGDMAVRSTIGAGTTFRVRLPVAT